MKIRLFRKGLVLGIIFLFVQISIQPAFAEISTESDNSELVEITIEICKGNGAEDHTVMLSQKQAEVLENIISRTKTKLDVSNDRKEASVIFNDAIVSLFELGVLPEGLSIEEAKRLVNGVGQKPRFVKILERWYSRNFDIFDDDENFLCLIAGHTDNTYFMPPFFGIIEDSPKLWPILLIYLFTFPIWLFNPLPIGNTIYLGSLSGGMLPRIIPAEGWVYTVGLNGIKTWSGTFTGDLGQIFKGALGFTGIKIGFLLTSYFYMGSALGVKIN